MDIVVHCVLLFAGRDMSALKISALNLFVERHVLFRLRGHMDYMELWNLYFIKV